MSYACMPLASLPLAGMSLIRAGVAGHGAGTAAVREGCSSRLAEPGLALDGAALLAHTG